MNWNEIIIVGLGVAALAGSVSGIISAFCIRCIPEYFTKKINNWILKKTVSKGTYHKVQHEKFIEEYPLDGSKESIKRRLFKGF